MEYLITEVLGPSIGDLLNFCGGKFTLKTTLMIFLQLIKRFENLHGKGVVHCDIKPENILMGLGNNSNIVHLVDFGISNIYRNKKGVHIPLATDCNLIGTVRYASANSHAGLELSRRDDMIALGYFIHYIYNGNLPWQDDVNPFSSRCRVVAQKKADFIKSV